MTEKSCAYSSFLCEPPQSDIAKEYFKELKSEFGRKR